MAALDLYVHLLEIASGDNIQKKKRRISKKERVRRVYIIDLKIEIKAL